jgi:hypothetical protein
MDVAAGTVVGAMTQPLVASARAADLLGAGLAQRALQIGLGGPPSW